MATNYFEFPQLLNGEEEMTSLGERLGVLEERVKNHIIFFWISVACLGAWLGWVSKTLYDTRSTVGNLTQVQANTPAETAAAILNGSISSRQEAEARLNAVSVVLQTSKKSRVAPSWAVIKPVSEKLFDVQDQYPDLPQVWKTTGEFINYRSETVSRSRTPEITVDCGNGGSTSFNNGVATFSKCHLTLAANLVGGVGRITFIDCVVDYGGGSVPSVPMDFYNCVFRFNVPVVPPPRGSQIMRLLAKSPSIESVQIPG